jgi:hypothetical protein
MAFYFSDFSSRGLQLYLAIVSKLDQKNSHRFCSGGNQSWKANPSKSKSERTNIF